MGSKGKANTIKTRPKNRVVFKQASKAIVGVHRLRVVQAFSSALFDFVLLPAERQAEHEADGLLRHSGQHYGIGGSTLEALREHFLTLCGFISSLGGRRAAAAEEAEGHALVRKDVRFEPIMPAKNEISVEFTAEELIVDGEHITKVGPLLLAEYIILRGEMVHWLWACVILRVFRPRDGKGQFRNYISKKKKTLGEWGIHIRRMKPPDDSFGILEGIEDRVLSTIKDVRRIYHEALSLYHEGSRPAAVKLLSRIAKQEYHFFTFTRGYMNLAKWITQIGYEGIHDPVLSKCESFLEWYIKRLRIGISRIEHFKRTTEFAKDKESLKEEKNIREELQTAERLYSALVDRLPLPPQEKAYEELVRLLLDARDELNAVEEVMETPEKKQTNSIGLIKELGKKNETFCQIIECGREVLRREIKKRPRAEKYSDSVMRDFYEAVYWHMTEVILELESFDEFDRAEGDRLELLKHRLCSHLSQKLRKAIE